MSEDHDEEQPSPMPENSDEGDENRVGYGRPPVHSRWKKGQSGNPRGRVKGQRNLKTDLREVLGGTIQLSEGGRARGISRQLALLLSLATRGIKGDARSAHIVLSLAKELLVEDVEPPNRTTLTPEEQAVVDRFMKRIDTDGDKK